MKSRQQGPMVTLVATEAITKNRFVDAAGAHTADKHAVGVALFDTDSGDEITVQAAGIATVVASGAITQGDHVKSDADGKAATLAYSAAADAAKACGVALDAATTDGDVIRVRLF